MDAIKVAILEENSFLREGLRHLIDGTTGYKCVGSFADTTDFIYNIRRAEPHVILMDIDLSGKMTGIEASCALKMEFPHIFIIARTISADDKTKLYHALKCGASGYLLKNTSPAKLLEAIQDVVKNGCPMTPVLAKNMLDIFRQSDMRAPKERPLVSELTERQKQILNDILAGKPYKVIADNHDITEATVKFHVKNIYEILQIHSRHELTAIFKFVNLA